MLNGSNNENVPPTGEQNSLAVQRTPYKPKPLSARNTGYSQSAPQSRLNSPAEPIIAISLNRIDDLATLLENLRVNSPLTLSFDSIEKDEFMENSDQSTDESEDSDVENLFTPAFNEEIQRVNKRKMDFNQQNLMLKKPRLNVTNAHLKRVTQTDNDNPAPFKKIRNT